MPLAQFLLQGYVVVTEEDIKGAETAFETLTRQMNVTPVEVAMLEIIPTTDSEDKKP